MLKVFESKDLKCLETRRRPDGLRRRRYESGGVKLATVEIPVQVFRALVHPTKLTDRLASWQREHDRKARKAAAMQMLRGGDKAVAVAHFLNISVRTVEKYATELRRE